ncbi:MAG TPA: SRPBCC domain-containing protein [Thiolinea sp.]|nr:SRPBCC domain-containing protein [Thiolinea sp.]
MWTQTYTKTVDGLSAERVWKAWTDINQWHTWQDDIEHASLEGEFKAGNSFRFKPKGGPTIKIELTEVKPNTAFVDLTRFFLAKMYDSHELIKHDNQLEIKTTIRLEGPLAFLWRKLVVQDIVNGLPAQTEKLIARARSL